MRTTTRVTAVLAAAGAIMAGTLVYGPAASAAGTAADCAVPYVANRDAGYGVMKGSYNLKRGPYQDGCGNVTKVGKGRVMPPGKIWV